MKIEMPRVEDKPKGQEEERTREPEVKGRSREDQVREVVSSFRREAVLDDVPVS